MALELTYFSKSNSLNWHWPVNVGIVGSNADFILENIGKGHWSEEFSHLHLIELNHQYNIVYTEDAPSELLVEISKTPFQTNVVLIKTSSTYEESDLTEIANQTNAHAVLIVNYDEPIHYWFENVIVELSHNKALIDALDCHCAFVKGLYNYQLDSKTTLSYLLYKMSEVLRDRFFDDPTQYTIVSRITPQQPLNLEQVSNELQDVIGRGRFDHESGEATGTKQFIESVNEQLGISILDEQIMEPQSPPANLEMDDSAEAFPEDDMPEMVPKMDSDEFIPDETGAEPEEISEPKESPTRGDVTAKNSAKPENEIDEKRFLQAAIIDQNGAEADSLLIKSAYKVKVRIGGFSRKWKQSKEAFPSEQVFTDPKKDSETLQLHFKSNLSKTLQISEITLNRSGNSDEAEFNIQTPETNTLFESEIYVYHKNRLIQKANLTSHVLSESDDPDSFEPTTLDVDLKFVSDLANLNDRTQFAASIVDPGTNGDLEGIVNNEPLNLNFSTALETLVTSIRDRIQNAVISFESEDQDILSDVNQELLFQLALDGNDLYVNHLKQRNDFNGPIQIISKKDGFVPFDFVYSYPTPTEPACVCDKAKDALLNGKCCGKVSKDESSSKYVCPFGFFGMSQIIEHHTSQRIKLDGQGDYTVLSEPGKQRKPLSILKNTLFATSQQVYNNSPKLNEDFEQSVQTHSKHSLEATNWDDWSEQVKKEKPDSLILIVHIEKRASDNRMQVEIGEKQFLLKNLLDKSKIGVADKDHPPFVIFIGCEAQELEYLGFDLASQLMNHGAAIVISNFTKIRGRHAAPIVMKLLEFLKSQENREFSLGEILLKLRQYLLANGIIVGFALITLGDADWKIKVAS